MKSFLRSFLFVYIALYLTQQLIGAFSYDKKGLALLILALTLINIFSSPLLKTLSLPEKGIFFFFLNSVLIFITLYLLTLFLPNLRFVATDTKSLNIFSFVIPSKHFTPLIGAVVSALVYGLLIGVLNWICKCKK